MKNNILYLGFGINFAECRRTLKNTEIILVESRVKSSSGSEILYTDVVNNTGKR